MKNRTAWIAGLLVTLMALGGCDALPGQDQPGTQASGIVEAVEVGVSAELGGRVLEVFVEEGQPLQAGDLLFRLDGELLQAQLESARAGLEAVQAAQRLAQSQGPMADANLAAAQAQVDSAVAGLEMAKLQQQQALYAARGASQPQRIESWSEDTPAEFDLPPWYFGKTELLRAANQQVERAQAALETERENIRRLLAEPGNQELAQAEARLLQARAAYDVAQVVLERARRARDRQPLEDYAQDAFDAASTELEAAQKAYDQLLTESGSADVLEGRGRLMVAEESYQAALDAFTGLLTGAESLEVRSAQAGVRLAEAQLAQAQAAQEAARLAARQVQAQLDEIQAQIDGAQSQIRMLEIQLSRLEVRAPVAGTLLTRSLQAGEVIQPGVPVMVIGRLDELTVTVYLPEDEYGAVKLGDRVPVSADSFPGESFEAVVLRIADEVEFTPRNVQTEEDRRTTVYAVELSVADPQGRLKPGMPVDVTFP